MPQTTSKAWDRASKKRKRKGKKRNRSSPNEEPKSTYRENDEVFSESDLMDQSSVVDEEDESDEEEDFYEDEQEILPLDMQEDSEDEEDEDEDDEDDEDGEIEVENTNKRESQEKMTNKVEKLDLSQVSWGRNMHNYYNADTGKKDKRERKKQHLREDEEEIMVQEEEEEEAKRLQKIKANSFTLEDFDEENQDLDADDDDENDENEGELEISFENRINKKSNNKKNSSTTQLSNVSSKDLEDFIKEARNELNQTPKVEVSKKIPVQEKLHLLSKESPEIFQLLEDFKTNISELKEKITPELEKSKITGVTSSQTKFLQLKYKLLLSYCTNIGFYLLLKTEGKAVKGHPVIETLLKIRTMLEKIELHSKEKTQINKLMKLAKLPQKKVKKSSKPKQSDDTSIPIKVRPLKDDTPKQVSSPQITEERFVRIPLTKKDHRLKEKKLKSGDSSLAFDDLSDLEVNESSHPTQIDYSSFESLLQWRQKPRPVIAGDEDIPYPLEIPGLPKEINSKELSNEADFFDDDMDGFQEEKKAKKPKIEAKPVKKIDSHTKSTGVIPKPDKVVKEGQKRMINYAIKNNKTYHRKRNKLNKNPRLKNRVKYDRAVNRRVGLGIKKGRAGVQMTPYAGEASGVKANIVRSISLREDRVV